MLRQVILPIIIFLRQILTDDIAMNETYLFSESFKNDSQGKVFKNFLKDDQVNYTDSIYTELIFNFNQDKPAERNLANFKINVYWFTDLNKSAFSSGIFYGVGQTKEYSNYTFSDLVICKLFQSLIRCDDYYIKYNKTTGISQNSSQYNITQDLLSNFIPIKDFDDILSYELKSLIATGVSPFETLLNFKVTLPIYADHPEGDLDLDFRNNLTIFFGNLFNESEDYLYRQFHEFDDFHVMRAVTKNITAILLEGSILNYSFSFLNFLLFLLVLCG